MAFPDELLADEEQVTDRFGPHWIDFVLSEAVRFATYAALACAGTVIVAKQQDPYVPGVPVDDSYRLLVGFGVILMALVGVALVLGAIVRLLRWTTTHYAFTNQRVLVRHGILNRDDQTVALDMIRGIDIRQDLVSRIIGKGDVRLNTAVQLDRGVIVLRDVHRPREVQRRLRELAQEATR